MHFASTARARAALWMLGSVVSLCTMALSVRDLSAELTVFQILFLRSLIGLPVVLAVLLAVRGPGGLALLKAASLKLHLVRNGFHVAGQGSWIFAVTVLPLATVFAVEFSSPLWAVLIAALIFTERPTRWQTAGILIGLSGILMIVRPWDGPVSWGILAALAAAFGYACNFIATRAISQTDTTWSVLFWMAVMQTPVGFAGAVFAWNPLGWSHAPYLMVLAITGVLAHLCMTNAFRLAPVADVVPFDYLRLPLITVLAALIYGDPIDFWVVVGGAIVIAGVALTQMRRA